MWNPIYLKNLNTYEMNHINYITAIGYTVFQLLGGAAAHGVTYLWVLTIVLPLLNNTCPSLDLSAAKMTKGIPKV